MHCFDHDIYMNNGAQNMIDKATHGKARITNRINPCNCGCGGKDPWHAREFVRKLRNPRQAEGQTRLNFLGYGSDVQDYDMVAEVKFPWGMETIVRHIRTFDGKVYVMGWCRTLDREYFKHEGE